MSNSQKKKNAIKFLIDGGAYILGGAVYAFSINAFTLPNNIAPGGATGLATLVHYLFGTPVGIVMILINIPLFFLGARKIGAVFIARTIVATLIQSFAIDIFAAFVPGYKGDMLLAALYGGVISGVGLSIVYLRGATTGGSDLLAQILNRQFRHISLGKFLAAIDFLIILAAALVFKSIDSALYSLITIFTMTVIVDKVLYGLDTGKVIMVFSPKNEEIAKEVMMSIKRGVTLISSRGAYSSRQGEMLLCAVRRVEVYHVRDIIYTIDPNAFIIVGVASEIVGQGFKPLEEHRPKAKRQKKNKF